MEQQWFSQTHQIFLMEEIMNWSGTKNVYIDHIQFHPFDGKVVKALVYYKQM